MRSSILYCYFLLVTLISVAGKDVCRKINQIKINNEPSTRETKLCRYRDEGLLPYQLFRYRSGEGCYRYFPSQWFSKKIPTRPHNYTDGNYSCTFPAGIHNGSILEFDYKNDAFSKSILSSFRTYAYFAKWQSCAMNADSCCNFTMNNDNILPSPQYPCPTTWDAWSCFHSAHNGSISESVCPEYTSSAEDTPCTLYSRKECFLSGTWNTQTDYSTCATAPVYRRRHNFHVISLYISIALSAPAVLIFLFYKNLRILRVNLHCNLLISCILRSVLTIVTKEVVILDALKPSAETNNVLIENGIPCRVLAYFNSVATNAIYACMLVDGFFLHKIIVRIFNKDPNVYLFYAATLVLSFVPTTIWAIVIATKSNELCWVVDSAWYQWIPDGFRIAILAINVLLLADIIRVLLKKLKRNVTAQHTKSTLKAMSFLIPLFGVPFILTASRGIVSSNSCTAGDIYYYVSYAIQSFQGVMVAVLFCYCNKEVHTQIKRSYKTLNIMYLDRFRKTKRTNQNIRRDTAATYVPGNPASQSQLEDADNSTANNTKKVGAWLSDQTFDKVVPNDVMAGIRFDGISKFIDDSQENLNVNADSSIISNTNNKNESGNKNKGI